MSIDPKFITVLSDLFVNLSAGWFGAALILPISFKRTRISWILLTGNLLSGTLSLIVSYLLRRTI